MISDLMDRSIVPIFSADIMNKGASFASCAQAFEVPC